MVFGRLNLVENRFVGMKSRGIYETLGRTVLLIVHRAIESLILDRGATHLKDELIPRYAKLIYYVFFHLSVKCYKQLLIYLKKMLKEK
ncbi:argininosuccinate synthase [Bartonella sp. AR 15-3]|nr:argininosuccinate synthase [Bartonella sp. AR 15-3]